MSARDDLLIQSRPYEDRISRVQGLIHQDNKKEAFRALSDLIVENPDDLNAIKLMGDALAKTYPGLGMVAYELVARRSGGESMDAQVGAAYCIDKTHPEAAYGIYRELHERDPECSVICGNMACVCADLGEHEAGLEWGRKALALDPDNPDIAGNASLSLLATGDWKQGWPCYRCSFGEVPRVERFYMRDGVDAQRLPVMEEKSLATAYDVERHVRDVSSQRLVVYGEQGIGDEVLFLSMLPYEPFCEKGFIETTPRMANFIQRSFPEWEVHDTLIDRERIRNKTPEWALQEDVTHKLEMGGLGEFFAPEPFRRGRYMESCPVRRNMWRHEFGDGPAHRVKPCSIGLAWTGGTWKNGRGWRSCAPTVLRDLIDAHPDVNWVSLEYLPHEPVKGVAAYPWATQSQDVDDIAALVDSLDLIIAVTTSVVDIGGALGKPVWCMVPKRVTWRYGTKAMGEEMFFYESVRCFRQEKDMDWSPTVKRISDELAVWKADRKAA